MTYAWFDLGNGREVYRRIDTGPAPQRSDLPTPMIMTDNMEPTQHPCDGRHYTSKAAFRATTRAHGCVEMGNDPARLKQHQRATPERKTIRESLKKASQRASA